MWEALAKNAGTIGSVLGGVGSIYSGYNQQKMGKKMFDLEKNNLFYNRDLEKKRTDGLGNIGSYYSGVYSPAPVGGI